MDDIRQFMVITRVTNSDEKEGVRIMKLAFQNSVKEENETEE